VKLTNATCTILLVLALAGCGGGGGGSKASSTAAGSTNAPSATTPGTSQPGTSRTATTPSTPATTTPATTTPATTTPATTPATSATDPHLQYALDAINASRAMYGANPVTLDVADCACALRHATDVANCANFMLSGFTACAHADFKSGDTCHCTAENQGVSTDTDEDAAFQAIHDQMMAEGPPPAGQINHFYNITNPRSTQVAIGEYVDSNGTLWVSTEYR
jgi:hypothetical protein